PFFLVRSCRAAGEGIEPLGGLRGLGRQVGVAVGEARTDAALPPSMGRLPDGSTCEPPHKIEGVQAAGADGWAGPS
ncbi:MAG: hypothetical protein ACK50F_06550, partial [Betaproteobacteria bacterium]